MQEKKFLAEKKKNKKDRERKNNERKRKKEKEWHELCEVKLKKNFEVGEKYRPK